MDKYPQVDWLIKNGWVIDPYQGINGKCNVAILEGKMVALPQGNSEPSARNVADAEGCLVIPGMIDFHTHFFFQGSAPGVNPDIAYLPAGVTMAVDQGSAGLANCRIHMQQAEHYMIRTKFFMHISPMGQIYLQHALEPYCPDKWNRWEFRSALEFGGDRIAGLKMRFQKGVLGDNDSLTLLQKALDLANDLDQPLCIHMTDPALPMQQVASMLRPGDIVAHIFQGRGYTMFDENGEIYPEILEARSRGVYFDMAHGGVNFSPKIAGQAIQKGFYPDFISSDNTKYGWLKPDLGSLDNIMSMFLALGMPLPEIIRCVTENPARALGMEGKVGTLKPGAYADVTFLKIVERDMTFTNSFGEECSGAQMIVPQAVILNGEMVYKPEDSLVKRSVYKYATF